MKNLTRSVAISMLATLSLFGASNDTTLRIGAARLELHASGRGGGETPGHEHVRIMDPGMRDRVTRGIASAREKLKDAGRLEILDRFTQYLPVQGRYPTLRESLDRNGGGDALAHFGLLVFLDGESTRECGSNRAHTAPGSTKVYICDAFMTINDASEEGDALIHEWLHSLGLCESPACDRGYPSAQRPTSGQIQVALRHN